MSCSSTGSYKSCRKTSRKQSRYSNMLFCETNIKCCNTPSNNIFVGNAGLVSGIYQEDILNIFIPYGPIKKVVMIPGKSYSFLVFKNIEDAKEAYKAVHGKKLKGNMNVLYLSYVETVPERNTCWDYDQLPPGLSIIENFVDFTEETMLLDCVQWGNEDSTEGKPLKHRNVKHYGYEFRYGINNVIKDKPMNEQIPAECDFLFQRLRNKYCLPHTSPPNQLTVNEYLPGQGIPSHIDTHSAFDDCILSLSLGSAVVMDFKHKGGHYRPVLLPQRSLLIISAESRYSWTHGITPRKMDIVPGSDGGLTIMKRGIRTSFTFRWVLNGECRCNYVEFCDSFKKLQKHDHHIKNDATAEALEKLHVHEVYEEIANHFSDTRHKPWPKILAFVQSLPLGSLLVDIGCGNGKYFGFNTNIYQIGCDHSSSLTEVCNSRGFQVFKCNCLNVPLNSNTVDACLSIAVIHHLATKERRMKAIEEIVRILRVKGKAIIYVWAKNQEHQKNSSNYLKQNKKHRLTDSRTSGQQVKDENQYQLYDVNCQENKAACMKLDKNISDLKSSVPDEENCLESSSSVVLKLASTTIIDNSEISSTGKVPLIYDKTKISPQVLPNKTDKVNPATTHTTKEILTLPVHTNRTQFQFQDLLVPWKVKNSKHFKGKPLFEENLSTTNENDYPVYYRYYHVFEEGELEDMCSQLQDAQILHSYYDQGNWCVIIEKVP